MMLLVTGIIAGLIAGIGMALVSEMMYRFKVFKSSQLIIDGTFACKNIKLSCSPMMVYIMGVLVHCVTSAVFGFIFALLSTWLHFDMRMVLAIVPYVIVLWLAMLFIALPVAGQGILGRHAGPYAWLEQLVLHIIFGIIFYFAIGII